jgi:hypothetical protein
VPFNRVVTPDDLKKGDLVDPGNYPVEFSRYEEKDAADKSVNSVLYFKVFDDSNPQKGKEFVKYMNEKGWEYEKELLVILFGPPPPEGYRFGTREVQSKLGIKFKLYVKRGKNKETGKEFNECAGYMPL